MFIFNFDASDVQAKVEVMLFKWALADPLKLQVVSNALRATSNL